MHSFFIYSGRSIPDLHKVNEKNPDCSIKQSTSFIR